jgi:hypothetical protein
MNEVNEVLSSGGDPANQPIKPLGSTGRIIAPNVNRAGMGRAVDKLDVAHSDGGYNFSGVDSLGSPVKGFVQTEDAQAANELSAPISVESIAERRGPQKNRRRPASNLYACRTVRRFMEVGESPTQVCRAVGLKQTNRVLADAFV